MSTIGTTPAGAEEAAQLLARFVAIPSITLAQGQSAPDARYGEARMAEAVIAYLAGLGLTPAVEEIEPGRPQVTVGVGNTAGPDLLLTSHLDTVAPVGWAEDPFVPRVLEGRLHGLGACDDKGCLVAMLLALGRIVRRGRELPGRLTFIAMVGEEMFGVGSRALTAGPYRPDAAIVGEPTEMRVVRMECGNVRWRVHTTGRAAHGSRPWEGDSAIYRMGDVLRLLRDEVAPAVRAIPLPPDVAELGGIGAAAMNAGVIRGGSGVNIVPDRCTLDLERRVLPGEDPVASMEAINAHLRDRLGSEHLEFEPPIAVNHPLATPPDHPVVRAFSTVLEEFHLDPAPAGVSFGSDANRLAAVHVPCVLFGPGSIRQAHTNDEWVCLQEVYTASCVLESVIERYWREAAQV